ncbi:adm-2 [Pristionchus pacificus]|uniref:Adm-2 n=1 Tax=Pristionchus pacificus TaxID=54126 RepID=A0A2A6BC51_PRIPA|nr:adm-2 [Pristionchus pacificus]|eukprot:PDM63463.1 adm-2 [Pristionchus pacificus]
MECPISLTYEGTLLSPSSLVALSALTQLPSITFHGQYSQFTVDYTPATGLDPNGRGKSCHFEGVDQSGRQSWLSSCSLPNLALIVRTADNVFRLRTRVAKANPDYYSEFAETLQRRRFVEFAFVADHSVYEKYDKDEDKVLERLQTISNMMNSFYKPINIEIRLVYTEVWTDADKIDVTADSDKTLDAFLQYRKTFLRAHPNDNAHMLTEVRFGDGVIGKAFKGTMCSFDYSGGVNVDHQTDAALVASTIAHEMGHNFGMDHDVDYEGTCKCPKNRAGITHCIMAKSAGWEAPSHWSDCSLNYLQTSLGRGVDLCLLNEPDRSEKAVCGNGIVEEGEDCDCGQGGCNHDCCDASTCQLTTKAQSGTNSCDLPEFCDGETHECPADFFVQDGLKCPDDGEGHCYNGECGSRTEQCKKIWGETGKAASDSCYLTNIQGNIHGNCGYDAHYDNYTACPDQDKFCGRLHCDKDTEAPIFGNPSSVTVANSHFFNRDKNAYESCFVIKTAYETNNKRKHTPGMTLDGTKCGKGKVCLQTKCVNVADLMKTASKCENDCYGHGVCNNVGNCHCENGYGGVACNIPGLGGSVNSNPANMSRGMDVFIITLVVLILCLIGFVALTIDYKRKGKGFLPGIIWKHAKETLQLRGVLVPTRKAPPPPRSRMKKDSLNEAWGEGGVVTYTANPPPLVASVPSDARGFASPASSPDPLLNKNHHTHVEYHKPALVAPSSISPRPRDPPPSIPTRPRDSAIVQLHSQHAHELGIRTQAPPPPPIKKEANRPAMNPPPPPPHKPKTGSKPLPPAKPSKSEGVEGSSSGVKGLAARFEKK